MSWPTDVATGDKILAADFNLVKNGFLITALAGENLTSGDAVISAPSDYFTVNDAFTGTGALTGYNSWTCHVNGGSDVSTITGNYATLRSGGNNAVGMYKNFNATIPASGREAHLKFKFTEGNSVGRTAGFSVWGAGASAYLDGTGIQFTDTPGAQTVTIVYSGSSTASGSITVPSAGNSIYIWIDIIPNGASNVDISWSYSTTLVKPSTPNGTATNKTPTASNYMQFALDAAADKNIIIDDLYVWPSISTIKFFKANATYADRIGFLGFVTANVNAGSTAYVRTSGAITTSGLTPNVGYYLSDTAGLIQTTAGTNSRKVGFSHNATQLVITNIW